MKAFINLILKIKQLSIILIIILAFTESGYSQNCSVNANVDFSVCVNDSISLNGAKGGLFHNDSSTIWIQVSGPSVIISNPFNLSTKIFGYQAGNTYKFRLLSICEDNVVVYDDVEVTVKSASQANAGIDTSLCPGIFQLSANSLNVGEMGYWDIEGVNNGITINTINNPSTNIQLSETKSGITILKWTVINPNGCNSTDEVAITNKGGVNNVSAGADRILTHCYNTSTNLILNGSYGGSGVDGQIGTWSTISGPSTPNILSPNSCNSTVTGLIEGTYILQWSVTGTCTNNTSLMNIVVNPSAGPITTAGSGINPSNLVICDTSLRSIVLNGPNPQYPNEVTEWTQVTTFPCTIESPTSPTTTVSNMNGNGAYQFLYQITNTITGCATSSLVRITYATPTSILITSSQNMILPLDSTFGIITYEFTGGNTTKYAIISTPSSIITNPQYVNSASPQIINGLDEPGQYIVRFKRMTDGGVGSCFESYADVIINVSFSPHSSNAGTNQVLGCNITSTTLVGNELEFEFGSWSQISGPSIANIVSPNNNITEIINLTNGNYRFRWSVNGGINSPTYYSDVNINVSLVTPTQANAGYDILNTCYNSPIDLAGNQPLNNEIGTWSTIPENSIIISDINNPNTQISGLVESSSYKLIWSIRNECGSTHDTILLTTNATMGPTPATAGPDQCLANGTNHTQLNGNTATNCIGEWTQIAGAPCDILSPNNSTTEIIGLITGSYSFVWTLSLNNCSSKSDTMTITVSSEESLIQNTENYSQCSNSMTISGSNSNSGVGVWTQLSGPTNVVFANIHNYQNNLQNLTAGSYSFVWKVTFGVCTLIIDTLHYQIYTPPTTAYAGVDLTICAPDSIAHLNANTPSNGTGFWSFISGPSTPIFSNYNNPNATVRGLIMGTYTLRWNIQGNANCPTSFDDVVISYSPLANAGAPIKLCNRSTVSLTGTANSIGTWTFVSGPNTPVINTIGTNNAIANNLIHGVYTFKYTINGGCSSFATTTVTNYEMPTLSNAGSDQFLCNSNSVQLTGNTPSVGTAIWSRTGPGAGTFSPNASSSSITYAPLDLGTHIFTWKITNGVCITSDYTIIRNFGAPTTSFAGRDTIICGQSIRLNANQPIVGNGEWSLVSGPGSVIFSNPNLYNSQATCNTPGLYKFKWTISSGNLSCGINNNFSEVNIQFLATPPVAPNAGIDKFYCNASEITLSGNNVSPGVGYWTIINGPNSPTIVDSLNPSSTLNGLIPGNYSLSWNANFNSCFAQDSIKIVIHEAPSASITGSDIEVCQYNQIQLTGNQPIIGNGVWVQQTGPNNAIISHPTSNSTSIIGVIPGEYIFEWRITNGNCPPEKSEIKIQVIENPTQSIAGLPQQLCNQNSVVLTGNMPTIGHGEWSLVSGPNNPTITPTSATSATVTNLTFGNYVFKWTIKNQICESSSMINITNNAPPSIMSFVTPSCNTGSITLVSNFTENQTFYLYSQLGSLISSWTGVANSNTFNDVGSGTYYGKISRNLCNSNLSNSIQLTNRALPTKPSNTSVDRNNLCPNDNGSITLISSGGVGDSIAWYAGANSTPIFYGNTLSIASPNSTTTYYSAMMNTCGVSPKDSIIVIVQDLQPPIASIAPLTITTIGGACYAENITLIPPIASDNCGIANINHNCPNTLSTGSHSIVWTITDLSGNSNQITQEITVISSPNATVDNYTIENGHSAELLVLENDIDCDHNINTNLLSIISAPAHGLTTINNINGSIIYTPDVNYVGFDTLYYQICDSTNLCNSSKVVLEITQSNLPPSINDSLFTTIENTEINFCIPITDIYGPFPFNVHSYSSQNGVILPQISSNMICASYTPNLNYIGQDSIYLHVCDNGGLCDSALIIITILPKMDLPKIALTQKATLLEIDKNGNFIINYIIKVNNIGETNLININIFDTLQNTFNNPISYTVIAPPQASGSLIPNIDFNGNTEVNLLTNNSQLSKNTSDSITFTVMIKPNGLFGEFNNYCHGSAFGLNQIQTIDIANNGDLYDENNNGNPNEDCDNKPTPINLYSIPKFGLTQQLVYTNQISEKSYSIELQFKINNIGNDTIHHLDLQNNLTNCFLNSNFSIKDVHSNNNNIIINPFFDGKEDFRLLQNADSYISINDSSIITVSIIANIDFGIHTYFNSATLFGLNSGNDSVYDLSDNSPIVDRNSNGITNEEDENRPTEITIGENEIWIPSGFSPNEDGENDYLVIKGNEYYTIKIQIINRWGNTVYESSDYQDDWNGKPNTGLLIDNNIVPEGTYFYIIDLNNNSKQIQGSITIKK